MFLVHHFDTNTMVPPPKVLLTTLGDSRMACDKNKQEFKKKLKELIDKEVEDDGLYLLLQS